MKEREEDRTYQIIYADPPWRYRRGTTTPKRAIDYQYPTMDLNEIKSYLETENVPVAKDAALFLWATSTILPDAFDVISSWGFHYKSSIVWDKERMGLGHWVRIQHEFILIGSKGKQHPPALDATQPRSIIREKSKGHSKKPLIVYNIIENMFPNTKKIELFARNRREGWTSWGNQIGMHNQSQLLGVVDG